MNNLSIAGRLGNDAKTRQLQSGDSVTSFDVAVSVYAKGERGTMWVRCSMWGERGEKLAQYLTKGSPVAVCGEARATCYTPRDGGEPVAQLELRVNNVTLLGSSDSAPRERSQERVPQQAAQATTEPFDEESIPF